MAISDFFARLFGQGSQPPAAASPAAPPPRVSAPGVAPPPPPVVVDYEDDRIPDACRPLIAQIRFLISDIEERAAAQPVFCPMVMELGQMRDQHLPKMLISYFEIPPQHRAEIFRRTGKSASFLLTESLQKMADRLDAMSRSLAQDNIDAFTSNLRFIEGRYGEEFNPA